MCVKKDKWMQQEFGLAFSNSILKKVRCCDWLSADLFLVYCVLCSRAISRIMDLTIGRAQEDVATSAYFYA